MLSEKDLIKGCKECNINAQQELYKRYASKMNAICYNYTKSSDDAKDILHEGFIKVFSNIRTFKEDGSLEGWVRRIMVNTAIDFLRKKRLRPDSISDSFSENDVAQEELIESEKDFINDLTQEELMEIINRLPDEDRFIFNMFCFEQYSHKEISEALSIREDTCRSKLSRAKSTLRKYFEELRKEKINHLKK